MSEVTSLSRQVRRVALGYFFLYINLTVNGWNLLPPFVGWVLFRMAIFQLKSELPKLDLLEGFSLFLCVWSVVEWLPVELPGWLSLLWLVFQLMELYFHFQLLTELAGLASRCRQPGQRRDRAQGILRARTGTAVLYTTFVLLAALPIPEEAMTAAAFAVILVQFGFCLYTMSELFSLAKELEKAQGMA